ncbi:rho GTPase activating protein [Naegleria gruberi]|uniref:Rho GTPase activating protein n=1 Tax=Naegleria gruberi TaxID=5762 RepID=D2VHY6_NAEGR|nr:rho GTPase activating protein [Naegleria gruberi]EFC43499.1 rho GTPase activating protein [Naegleria gruberi]|eukprot:XP_002676243.1 rho GTPase activating protein [Naegleria gruberi strain NEG-M]
MSQFIPSTLTIQPSTSSSSSTTTYLNNQQQEHSKEKDKHSNRKSLYLVKVHFGQALSESEIPEFIIKSMKFLLKHCYNVEGLFRISGNAADISKLKKQLNDGQAIELKSIENVHNIAGLVKMYFRELPNPLMTFECYDMFVIADSIPDEYSRLDCIKKLLAYIPPSNRLLLQTYRAGQNVVRSLIDHVDYFFMNDCLSYIEYLDTTLNTTIVCSSPSATTKISEEIYGSSVEEVTSSIKNLSEKITRLIE